MPSRIPSPGSYRWLEWGPPDDGGSLVRDANNCPIRTGSAVVLATGKSANWGTVLELVSPEEIVVRWSHMEGDRTVPAASVRVVQMGTAST